MAADLALKKKEFTLVEQLVDSGCIKFGTFTLKSGLTSPYYVDLREATMHPRLFGEIVDALKKLIPKEHHNACWHHASIAPAPCALVGIPYGVVPLAAALAYSCKLHYYPVRKETKEYGHQPDAGLFDNFEFILIEDVMSTGSSIVDTIKKMEGKKITDVIVIVDRELGGREKLAQQYPNIRVHTVLSMADILEERKKMEETLLYELYRM